MEANQEPVFPEKQSSSRVVALHKELQFQQDEVRRRKIKAKDNKEEAPKKDAWWKPRKEIADGGIMDIRSRHYSDPLCFRVSGEQGGQGGDSANIYIIPGMKYIFEKNAHKIVSNYMTLW